MAKFNLSDWQVENLRLSAFLVFPINPEEMHLWKELMGESPDQIRNLPQQQLVTEDGPYLTGQLHVTVRNNRIDWKLFHNPKNSSHGLPTLGSYANVEEDFRKLMLRWIDNCPAVHRIAYGCVLLLPTESLSDAYSSLNDLLPAVDIDLENTWDLTYRINRKRDSRCGIEQLKINRLSTWSAAQIIDTLVDISAGGNRPPKVTYSPNSNSFCRLELDINTAAEYTQQLDQNFVPEIFSELIEAGNEIAVAGDVS